jgi:hypothetical protein
MGYIVPRYRAETFSNTNAYSDMLKRVTDARAKPREVNAEQEKIGQLREAQVLTR